jgi:hypothetical protein
MSNQEKIESKTISMQDYLDKTGLGGISTDDVRLPIVLTLAETCGYEDAYLSSHTPGVDTV